MSDLFITYLNASVENQVMTAFFAMIVLIIMVLMRRS